MRVTKQYANEESLFIYSGTSTSGTSVYQNSGTFTSGEFCITPGVVTLVMKDSFSLFLLSDY